MAPVVKMQTCRGHGGPGCDPLHRGAVGEARRPDSAWVIENKAAAGDGRIPNQTHPFPFFKRRRGGQADTSHPGLGWDVGERGGGRADPRPKAGQDKAPWCIGRGGGCHRRPRHRPRDGFPISKKSMHEACHENHATYSNTETLENGCSPVGAPGVEGGCPRHGRHRGHGGGPAGGGSHEGGRIPPILNISNVRHYVIKINDFLPSFCWNGIDMTNAFKIEFEKKRNSAVQDSPPPHWTHSECHCGRTKGTCPGRILHLPILLRNIETFLGEGGSVRRLSPSSDSSMTAVIWERRIRVAY